jgi:hypothetical protein
MRFRLTSVLAQFVLSGGKIISPSVSHGRNSDKPNATGHGPIVGSQKPGTHEGNAANRRRQTSQLPEYSYAARSRDFFIVHTWSLNPLAILTWRRSSRSLASNVVAGSGTMLSVRLTPLWPDCFGSRVKQGVAPQPRYIVVSAKPFPAQQGDPAKSRSKACSQAAPISFWPPTLLPELDALLHWSDDQVEPGHLAFHLPLPVPW